MAASFSRFQSARKAQEFRGGLPDNRPTRKLVQHRSGQSRGQTRLRRPNASIPRSLSFRAAHEALLCDKLGQTVLFDIVPCTLSAWKIMQFDQLSRREFIALISGVASSWPIAARAQLTARMRRIG